MIDPSPVLYIAKYNRVIDTSQVLNKSEDEVPEEDSKPIPERYVIFENCVLVQKALPSNELTL